MSEAMFDCDELLFLRFMMNWVKTMKIGV